jgi:hypothetical protein
MAESGKQTKARAKQPENGVKNFTKIGRREFV